MCVGKRVVFLEPCLLACEVAQTTYVAGSEVSAENPPSPQPVRQRVATPQHGDFEGEPGSRVVTHGEQARQQTEEGTPEAWGVWSVVRMYRYILSRNRMGPATETAIEKSAGLDHLYRRKNNREFALHKIRAKQPER